MRKSRYIILMIFLICLFDVTSSGIFLPVLMQQITMNKVTTIVDIAVATGFIIVLSSSYILSAPIIGAYSDFYKRRPMLLLCLLIGFLSYFICLIGFTFTTKVVFLLGILLSGISACALPLYQTIIADCSKGKQTLYGMALILAAMTLMPAASEISGYLLNITHSAVWVTRCLLAAASIFQLVGFVIVLNFLPETNNLANSNSYKGNYRIDNADGEYTLSAFATLGKKPIPILLILFILFCFSWGSYYQHISIHLLLSMKLSHKYTLLLFTYQMILTVIFAIVIIPWLVRYFSYFQLLVTGFLLIFLASMLLNIAYYIHILWMVWLATTFMAITVALVMPYLWYAFTKHAAPYHVGFVMGVFGPVWAICWAISSFFATMLARTHYELLWPILMLLTTVAIYLLKRYRSILFAT